VAGHDDFIELAPGALRMQPNWYQRFMTNELDLREGYMRLHCLMVDPRPGRWILDNEFGKNDVVPCRENYRS
jgi:hypothetical protein